MNTPTKTDIQVMIDIAKETSFASKFQGMTYEDGVIAALEWVIGVTETEPMED